MPKICLRSFRNSVSLHSLFYQRELISTIKYPTQYMLYILIPNYLKD